MLKNYFKTAIRNLSRHKSNATINIAGLAVGFAAFLIIFLVVQYEQSFDSFHAKKNRIYRVVRVGTDPVSKGYYTGVPIPVTPALRTELSQVANAAAISGNGDGQVIIPGKDGTGLKKFKEANGVFFAEPQFFQMFDFGLIDGDIKTALNEPNTILLTKATAIKYFGDWRGIIGKTLKMNGAFLKVTGVLDNPPSNTDFPIKAVLSYASLSTDRNFNNWNSINDGNYCFVELPDGVTPTRLSQSLAGFNARHIKSINAGYSLSLQPLNQMHYDERYGNFSGRTFSKDLILALSLIGLFLLVVACVNFINLTVAQAINRGREVGVRKVLGGSRLQLMSQFLGETAITCIFAFVISLLIVLFCLPAINNLLDIQLSASSLYSPQLILYMCCTLVMVSLLSGFYPALVLSGFKPVTVLKSGSMGADQKSGILFKRGLVVFQFVIAQVLIIGTLVVTSQMNYFRNADMGFRKNAVIYASFPADSLGHTKIDYLRNELSKIPGVEKVGMSMFSPSGDGTWAVDLRKEGNTGPNADMIVSMKIADPDFFNVYNIHLVAGRIYFPSDTLREFVVNEAVVRKLGIRNAGDAIGRRITINRRTLPIVGVVKDFHANSLRDPIDLVVMSTAKNGYHLASMQINLSKTNSISAAMEKIWGKAFHEYSFEYHFMDQTIESFYKQENQLSQLYKIFSAIAIFISCLGLYGLISFMAVQRKKEIGIRKVLGAPVKDIVVLLSKEFTMLVIMAFLIASPVAWYLMHQWLQGYTFHITLGAWFFVVTILSSISIAWLTVGYTAIKAALANSATSLRTE
ncbi:ABC transporter permease [Mucilaginibacter sp. UR6-11]|uniref:ABC transporter permease n=1 Tax=Mucilaginibacter sp. UR6-11 TaxID=1435644 RepID=UPI001E414CED|nr:ABC transporter permease [Mucilaginibacter sp. UR6-11]MCC8427273.1 ABC transporter permease [Mucilaginibacter sp. UR6-11]